MKPIIQQAKSNLCHMLDEVQRRALQCLLGLMFVRDIPHHGEEKGLVDRGWLAVEEIKNAVQAEPCIGNRTDDESQGDGLAAATFRLVEKAGERGSNKFILLVTNSGMHNPLYSGIHSDQLIEGLKKARIRVFIIGPEDNEHYRQICRATKGMPFDIDALKPEHYTHILSMIGQSIVGSMKGSMRS